MKSKRKRWDWFSKNLRIFPGFKSLMKAKIGLRQHVITLKIRITQVLSSKFKKLEGLRKCL